MSRKTPSPPRGAFKGLNSNSHVSLISAATGSIRSVGKQVRKLVKPRPVSLSKLGANTTAKAPSSAFPNFKPLQWLTSRFQKAPMLEELTGSAAPPSPLADSVADRQPTITKDEDDADDRSIEDTVSCLSQISFYLPRADQPSSFLDMDSDDESDSGEDSEVESMEALELFQTLSSIRVPPSVIHPDPTQPLPSGTGNLASHPSSPPATTYAPGIGVKPISSPFFISFQRPLPPNHGFGIGTVNERSKDRHAERHLPAPYIVRTGRGDRVTKREPWMTLVHILTRWSVGFVHRHIRSPPNTVQFPVVLSFSGVRDAVVVLSLGALPLCRLLLG